MTTLYAGEWAPEYGVADHTAGLPAGVEAEVWEHGSLQAVDCPATEIPLAFVDGVRRVEAQLFVGPESLPGIAGVLAAGAVVPDESGRLSIEPVVVQRLALFGGDQQAELPPQSGGWSWASISVAETTPDGLVQSLQDRMREQEWLLAQQLAEGDQVVCLDGPLHAAPALPIVGYVKTHHRRILGADDHRRVGGLKAGQRSSLFALGDRHSCYLRLAPATASHHPWFAVVRLEVAAALGKEKARQLIDRVAGRLPRFAGVAHVDPRAPQNLQAVGALEKELRRRCGDSALSTRMTRQAVRQFMEEHDG